MEINVRNWFLRLWKGDKGHLIDVPLYFIVKFFQHTKKLKDLYRENSRGRHPDPGIDIVPQSLGHTPAHPPTPLSTQQPPDFLMHFTVGTIFVSTFVSVVMEVIL